MSDFREEIIIAGFGGQGIILAGKLLAQTAMKAGKEVTYIPAYGAEMRGGTSNCTVIISDKPIASPMVSEPNTLIAMNKASLHKFGPRIKKGGLVLLNSSLINEKTQLDESIETLAIPADKLAGELGSPKSANMVAIGAYLQKRNVFKPDDAANCLGDILAKRHHKTLPVNTKALQRGGQFVKEES